MRPRLRVPLRTAAEVGLAHWFFGNLYEEVIGMPARIAEHPPPDGPFAPGSPVRYYLPAAPLTLAATFACVATGWGRRRDRPALAAAGLLLRLLDGVETDPAERQRLVRHWHAVNRVRLPVVAAAAVALRAGTRR